MTSIRKKADSSAQERRPRTAEKQATGTARGTTYIILNLCKISSVGLQNVIG